MGVIQRQGSKQSIIKLAGVVVGFLSLLFVYPLAHEAYGYAQFLYSCAVLLIPLMGMGISQSAVKFFADYENTSVDRRNFLWSIVGMQISALIVFGLLFLILREPFYVLIANMNLDVELFRSNEKVILTIGVLILMYNTCSAYISNYGRIVIPTIINELAFKIFLPVIVALIFIGYITQSQIPTYLIGFYLVAFVLLFVYMFTIDSVGNKLDLSYFTKDRVRGIVKYSLFSALSGLGAVLAFRLDAVMVTGLLDKESCGLYYNVLVMAMVIDIPNQAIGKISGPIISKSWTNNEVNDIERIYSKGSLNSLIIGLLIFLGIWCNIDSIFALSSKPEAFIGATQIFLFLGIAKLIDAATGINSHILIYSKYYKYNLLFLLTLGVLNVLFNLLFIKQYGVVGAAIATFFSLTIYNFIKYLFIKFSLEMSPFTFDTLKVLMIGLIVFAILWFLPVPNNHILRIAIRSFAIVSLFGGAIYFTKVSVDINALVDKYLNLVL